MEILAIIVLGFLGIRFFVSLLNLFTRPALPQSTLPHQAKVSILVPARNEAHNLPHLFAQLDQLAYENVEILILDDQSTDETGSILVAQAIKDPRLQVLEGAPLPSGWLGKHHACHQLARAATGEYMLFLDADIRQLHPYLIQSGLHFMERHRLTLLSLFPDQIMDTRGEQITVPLMHYLLLSLLPLWWILRLPFPSMAAANGQFMLFDAESYRQHHWHQQVRQIIVDDIAIMQRVKGAQLRGMTCVANGLIHCRMYQSWSGGVSGFSKNILAGFGNSFLGLILFLGLTLFGWVPLIFYLPPWLLLMAMGLIVGIRLCISLLGRQSIARNLLLHPIQMLTLLWVSVLSIFKRLRKNSEWKGRNVQLQP
ncbi:MAG: glycosyltransferase [Bacteroidota bacterium]